MLDDSCEIRVTLFLVEFYCDDQHTTCIHASVHVLKLLKKNTQANEEVAVTENGVNLHNFSAAFGHFNRSSSWVTVVVLTRIAPPMRTRHVIRAASFARGNRIPKHLRLRRRNHQRRQRTIARTFWTPAIASGTSATTPCLGR
ncbi:hypothetical protein Tcan_00276, partial [Toxocara canis]